MSQKTPLDTLDARLAPECLAPRVSKQGCVVKLDGITLSRRVVDLDHPKGPARPKQKKCDYVLFVSEGSSGVVAAPLELKSSAVNPRSASQQLQAGARIVERLARSLTPVRLAPAIAHGRRLSRRTVKKMAEETVTFRGRGYRIALLRCGDYLAPALD